MGFKLKLLRSKQFPEHGSMKNMCDSLGVSPQTWNKWEAGVNIPSDLNQRKIAALFGISLAELRGDSLPLEPINPIETEKPPVVQTGGGEISPEIQHLIEASAALTQISQTFIVEVMQGKLPPKQLATIYREAMELFGKHRSALGLNDNIKYQRHKKT